LKQETVLIAADRYCSYAARDGGASIDTMETESNPVLYESVANDISAMIHTGTLTAGDRVPSVRRLSQQKRVSISTVLLAYRLLENRGLLEARPQSGYFVRARRPVAAEPSITDPPRKPRAVGVHDLVSRVLSAANDPRVVPLGAALPAHELMPATKLRRMLSAVARRRPESLTTYAVPPGREELRRQIARHALNWGCNLVADDVIVTNGCMEAVNLCLRAVAKAGDIIALESPTYFGLLQIIESLGMKALEIPTHPRTGISLDALALACEREKIKACLVMPNVSNPLGSVMPDAAKKRLVQMLATHDIPLIEDAVYGDLYFSHTAPRAAKAYDRHGTVMLCSSFSKTLAPGFRVGWVAPGRYHAQVEKLKFITSVGNPELLQLAVAEFLDNGGYDRQLRSLRRALRERVERMQRAVSEHFPAGTRVTSPSGGFVLWVQLPAGVEALALYERAMHEHIGIAPGPMFSASDRYRGCIRLNCGCQWTPAIEGALARLGELAQNLDGRKS
jgi:DNA-binding transcriptional MocR family regulator